jgi:UDP-glucose 4-epimerase/UDP-arabinose 4-epimerase
VVARILITGGAGYAGSHCAKALAESGHEGIVFDNLLFGHREFVRWGPLIEGDATAQPSIQRSWPIGSMQ